MVYINFCIGDEIITSMDNPSFNPFEVGDVINLHVNELNHHEVISMRNSNVLIASNAESRKKYHLKEIKLISVKKFFDLNNFNQERVIIEYQCEIVEK